MKLIKIDEVKKLTCLGTTTIYKLINEGVFPKQVKLSKNTSAWVEREVLDYIEKRIAERCS